MKLRARTCTTIVFLPQNPIYILTRIHPSSWSSSERRCPESRQPLPHPSPFPKAPYSFVPPWPSLPSEIPADQPRSISRTNLKSRSHPNRKPDLSEHRKRSVGSCGPDVSPSRRLHRPRPPSVTTLLPEALFGSQYHRALAQLCLPIDCGTRAVEWAGTSSSMYLFSLKWYLREPDFRTVSRADGG